MSRAFPILLVGLLACGGAQPPRTSEPAPAAVAGGPAPGADLVAAPAEHEPDLGHAAAPDSEPEPEELPPPAEQAPHPFADLSDEQLEEMLLNDPDSLGPLSLGRPNAGALVGGVQMPESDRWKVVNPKETWGTQETVDAIATCINSVNEQFPDTPVLPIGDIGRKNGGHLAPHVSHQSGRDVDIGYYYTTDDKWYTLVTEENLDFPRTWAFVKAFITQTDVEVMFIDKYVQKLLREYATSIGEDEGWLDEVFGGPSTPLRAIIRHEKGHRSHIHIRFYNPIAQESGRRMYRKFIEHKLIKPPTYFVKYKVRRGDTLMRIAAKFKTSVKAIKRANRLRSNRIYAKRTYKIPRRGGVRGSKKALVLPQRRLPPPPSEAKPPRDEERTAEAGTRSGGGAAEAAKQADVND